MLSNEKLEATMKESFDKPECEIVLSGNEEILCGFDPLVGSGGAED